MTARGTENADNEFSDQLAELSEMITKFSQDYTVILMGDLNSSLHRNKGIKRDRLLGKFKEENHLFLPVGHLEQSTFFHYNKRDTFQIDYFLCNKQSLVTSVAQEQRNPQNTSCHDPVKVKIQVKFKIISNEDTCEISSVKVNWEKIDKIKYATVLTNHCKI